MRQTITVRLGRELAEWLELLEIARANAAAQSFMRLAGVVRGGPADVSTRNGFWRARRSR